MQVLRRELLIPFLTLLAALSLTACDGGEVPLGGVTPEPPPPEEPPEEPPVPGQLSLLSSAPYDLGGQIRLNWGVVAGATTYRLYRSFGTSATPSDEDPRPGYEQLGEDVPAPPAGVPRMNFVDVLPPHLTPWRSVSYIVETCNAAGCQDSRQFFLPSDARGVFALTSRHNLKTSVVGRGEPREPQSLDQLGSAIAVSRNGAVIVVGTSVNTEDQDAAQDLTGSAYVFTRDGFDWEERARLRAADVNTIVANGFGQAVASSADGGTIAAGAPDAQLAGAGAAGKVYVFTGDGDDWTEEAVLSAPNPAAPARFGFALALSDDGNTLAVGSPLEGGGASGVWPSPPADGGTASTSGAVYIYARSGSSWTLESYIKPPVTRPASQFGWSLALSRDGATLAVGAPQESSAATGVDGNSADDCGAPAEVNCARAAGAVHVYVRNAGGWSHQAYLKASNTDPGDEFGAALALSESGNDLLIGAPREDSVARYGQDNLTLPEAQGDNAAVDAGAAYLFRRDADGTWDQLVYLKASNTLINSDVTRGDLFGSAVSISDSGALLAVGAPLEGGQAIGIGGDASNTTSTANNGAVFLYDLTSSFFAYIKETHRDGPDTRQNRFGTALSLSGDGATLAIGAPGDDYAWNPDKPDVAPLAGTVSARHPDFEDIISREDSGVFYVY